MLARNQTEIRKEKYIGTGSLLNVLFSVLCIRIHWIWIRIQHLKWIRLRIGSFNEQIFEKKFSWKFFLFLFWSNIAIYLFLGLYKGRPSYKRGLQSSKKNIQHFKRWNLWTIFYFSGSFLPSWIRIRIGGNANSDPDPETPLSPDPDTDPDTHTTAHFSEWQFCLKCSAQWNAQTVHWPYSKTFTNPA